jgi:uncharacterized membrane protein
MRSLSTVLARHRRLRDRLRAEHDLQRAVATAPTVESAHEIAALGARR